MAKTDKEGKYWTDARGALVPIELIPELDRARDALVERRIKGARKVAAILAEFHRECSLDIEDYLTELARKNKIKNGWRGNTRLCSFDDSLAIERAMSDRIDFDEKLQLAKAQIDVWINKRIGGIDPSFGKVISQAFNVDKRGKINTAMVLKLMHLDIDDSEWKKAMALLKESITVKSTKLYIRFKEKVKSEGSETWRNISLDFADCGGE